MQSRDLYNNNNTQKVPFTDIVREKKAFIGIGLLTIVILAGAVFFLSRGGESSVPSDQVLARNGIHWHPRLSITINGKKQEIPANVGIGAVHQPIHTHDQDAKEGVLHMEMQGEVTKDETKLGNFFRTWGKDFNSTQIFDKKNGAGGKVTMTINGKENKDFENYEMRDGDKIEIRYE